MKPPDVLLTILVVSALFSDKMPVPPPSCGVYSERRSSSESRCKSSTRVACLCSSCVWCYGQWCMQCCMQCCVQCLCAVLYACMCMYMYTVHVQYTCTCTVYCTRTCHVQCTFVHVSILVLALQTSHLCIDGEGRQRKHCMPVPVHVCKWCGCHAHTCMSVRTPVHVHA